MGQQSSQQSSQSQIITPAEASSMEHQRKSKDKRRKSKSKKKNPEMQTSLDQEEESALTLLHMREAPVHNEVSPYYEDKRGASVQLIPNGTLMRPSRDPAQRSKSRKTEDSSDMEKRGRNDVHDLYGVEDHSNEAQQYPDLPSSPPPQFNGSPSTPYRSTIPSGNPLDDIPTDDDDVAAYEEYAKDTASADQPRIPDQDIFNFSQQPPNPFDQDEDGQGMHTTYQLPTNMYALPQGAEKPKRKKKRKRHSDTDRDCQHNPAHEQGQHIPPFHDEVFDDFLGSGMSSANLLGNYQGDDMPIDPELHSMNTFPPSTDLNSLNDDDLNILQKDDSHPSRHDSSQPRKRRRLEELQGANASDLPYMSPYAFQHDQENIQDQVLPGFEDMQRQTSSGLGPAFSTNAAGGDAAFLGDGAPFKTSARRRNKSEIKKPRPQNQREVKQMGDEFGRSMKDKAENGGAFSAAEGLKLDAFRENHCEANEMTISQFNNLIQTPMRGNPQVTALFNDIHDILPYRPRMSVQKFCRRRFHNFSRGTWSAEEDEMLKQAVAEKGKAWKEVGDSLGRMSEDCRDRWRNYLVNSEHRNREQWTDAEVVNLCAAVIDCIQLMKEDRKRAKEEGEDVPEWGTESDQEVEDMKRINWQSVSDRMGEHGGGRSRLQCSFKWGQLKKREQADFLKAILGSRDIEKKKSTSGKNPWRMKLASKKVANMKSGDVHAFLQAVLDTNVPVEGNIPWKSLGDDEFRATWTSSDMKAAWSRLMEKVPGFDSLVYRSVANELLSQMMEDGVDAHDERWDPALHGDVSAKKTRKKRKPNKKKDQWKEDSDPTNRYLQRSNEFIDDSDAMGGNAEELTRLGAFEPEGYNRYDALPRADDMGAGVNLDYGAGSGAANDPDDLFTDGENANGVLPMADGEVNPDFAFARQLQSAINALP